MSDAEFAKPLDPSPQPHAMGFDLADFGEWSDFGAAATTADTGVTAGQDPAWMLPPAQARDEGFPELNFDAWPDAFTTKLPTGSAADPKGAEDTITAEADAAAPDLKAAAEPSSNYNESHYAPVDMEKPRPLPLKVPHRPSADLAAAQSILKELLDRSCSPQFDNEAARQEDSEMMQHAAKAKRLSNDAKGAMGLVAGRTAKLMVDNVEAIGSYRPLADHLSHSPNTPLVHLLGQVLQQLQELTGE